MNAALKKLHQLEKKLESGILILVYWEKELLVSSEYMRQLLHIARKWRQQQQHRRFLVIPKYLIEV